MTIIDDQTDYSAEVENISIVSAEYQGAYKIHLRFADGHSHTVDFEPFLREARNPMTTKYLDLSLFRQFVLDYGALHWNDYEMCFETAYLYNHTIIEYHGFG